MLRAEAHAPPVGARVETVGAELDCVQHAFALEQRLDCLVEPARDDQRPVGARKLGEARPDPREAEKPFHRLVERHRDRLELGGDHLVQRHRAAELAFGPPVDLAIAELLEEQVERVLLGDGAVPVED